VAGAALRAAAVPVAGAASREAALPIFTGVRVRARDGRLSLVATDRFRMAAATLAWQPAGDQASVGALVPAALLTEVAKQAGLAETVDLHVDGDRFGVSWSGGSVVAASLATPFPDRQIDQLLDISADCTVEAEADALSAAVQRAAPYAGPHGRVTIQVADGVLVVRGDDPLAGESEEMVKAATVGDHLTRCFQARLLLDALRPFAACRVQMRIQAGMRATAFTTADPDDRADLTYLVVPMRSAEPGA
jgi:DNA polymerase-3 subunit beta